MSLATLQCVGVKADPIYDLDGSITIDELIDYLVAEAEELKLDTLKVRPKALTIIPGPGFLVTHW